MSSLISHLYQFGEFSLDTQQRVLRRGQETVSLTPKAFDVLLLLIQSGGSIVTKDELMKAVWSDSFVEESNLTQTVFMVRKALDETSDRRYILTVQGQGYRFLVPVKEATTDTPAGVAPAPSPVPVNIPEIPLPSNPPRARDRRWAYTALATIALILITVSTIWLWRSRHGPAEPPGRIMLAVLPFQNLTGDAAQEYISDGLTEEMITQLGNLNPAHMGVIARTSVMHYKNTQTPLDQIGRELNAQYVIEGSVRRDADRVRITAQLIQVKDQSHVWARQYDRELKDLLNVQSEVAQEIKDEIQLTLGGRKTAGGPPTPPRGYEGYDLYLKGLYFFNKRTPEDLEEAVRYFQQATAKDPAYAQAYAGLAKAYTLLPAYSSQPNEEFISKARAAATKALELDEGLSEAHSALALIVQNHDWDWQTSEKEFRRAIELNPNDATAHHWYAEHLMWRGRFDEAIAESERAQQLDPLSLIIATDYGAILFYSRRYDSAIEEWRSVQEMDPNFVHAHIIMGAYVEKGMFAEALAEDEKLRSAAPDAPYWYWRAYIEGRAGQTAEARRAIGKLLQMDKTKPLDPMGIAVAYAAFGDKDQAFAWLEKAYAQHSNGLTSLKVDPTYDRLRGDPRFQDLLRRVGLEE
jgi:TolB-like protein/DNA-binding winged helix-turn-helix (wHTH) protein/Flp pilus assembly protein TadD